MTFTQAMVAACLSDRPYRYDDSMPSTMDAARAWLNDGAPHGSVVIAGRQTAGRGRIGRAWLNADGCALALSLVVRLTDSAALAQVSMLGGLVVYDALTALGVTGVSLKWPNDVLIGDKKVCGVLAEAAWDGATLTGAVLGIGLNVSGSFADAEVAASATSVEAALGHEPDAAQLLSLVIDEIAGRLPDVGTPALYEPWRSRLGTIGRRVRVDGGDVFEGVAEDTSATGALLVRGDDGVLRTVLAGDVRLRPVGG